MFYGATKAVYSISIKLLGFSSIMEYFELRLPIEIKTCMNTENPMNDMHEKNMHAITDFPISGFIV